MALFAHFQCTDSVLQKPVGPLPTVAPAKKNETGSRQYGKGKKLYDENMWLEKRGQVTSNYGLHRVTL